MIGTYLSILAMLMLVLSPLFIPVAVTIVPPAIAAFRRLRGTVATAPAPAASVVVRPRPARLATAQS